VLRMPHRAVFSRLGIEGDLMRAPRNRLVTPALNLVARLAVGLTALTLAGCELLTGPERSGEDELSRYEAPAGRQAFAVDVSDNQGYVAETAMICWWEAGVRHVIAGLQDADIAVHQLETAVGVGMTVDAYVPLYWGGDISGQVESALSVIAPFPVQRLWLDVEVPPGDQSPDSLTEQVQEAVDACGSFPCGIYTRKDWWLGHVADTTAFSQLPLWYAYYNHQSNFNDWYNPQARYEGPFGGWTDPTGKQYDSNETAPDLCGVGVDYNTIFALGPPAASELEVGRVTVGQADKSSWHSVSLRNSYVSPVVIMQPPSYNDGDPATIRIGNVSASGFQFRIDEWDYLDGAHAPESVAYLVVEAGVYRLRSGALLEAASTSAGHTFRWVPFSQAFRDAPVILTQVQSYREATAVVTRQRAATPGGFQLKVQEEEANDGRHAEERVGYVAVEPGVGFIDGMALEARLTADAVTSTWQRLNFAQSYSDALLLAGVQTTDEDDPAALRYRNLGSNGAEVFLEEERSADSEVGHTTEVVGYIVLGAGDDDDDGEDDPPPAPTGLSPSGGETITTSSVTLLCDAIAGVTEYEFKIEYEGASGWKYYYSYSSSASAQTFWPQYDDTRYRWQVRARNAQGWGPWSEWAVFNFGEGGGGELPPAPTGLSPSGGETITTSSVTLSCNSISGVTEYEFEIEYEGASGWQYYYTYTASTNSKTFWPQYDDTRYRWRVRARNAQGWGPWSEWAVFNFGEGGGGELPPAPTGLSPSGGETITTSSVTLSCNAISGVTEYEFEIEYEGASGWKYYYSYSSSTNSKTFWPQYDDTRYRWRVRARNAQGWGPWSVWAIFRFGSP